MSALSAALERVARLVARHPAPVLAAVVALSLAGGALALRLEASAATDTLVSRSSDTFTATEAYHRQFGDDAILVLVREDLPHLVLGPDLERVLGLEGCLSGNVPSGVAPPGGAGGPCAGLARGRPVRVVYGPGTFVNEAVRQIQIQFSGRQQQKAAEADQAARAARKLAAARGYSPAAQRKAASDVRKLVNAQFVRDTLQLALRYGIKGIPRLNDPGFVSQLVFDPSRGANTPKARFAYLFPNARSALIQVRLRPDLSDAQRDRAIALVRQAVAMPEWRLKGGGSYTVSGAPVVVADVAASLTDSIVLLLILAVIAMAATLVLVFRTPRMRLLPLGVALAACGLTFGAMELVGARLTIAAIGVLPILIGLAVDYAIQLQSRWDEELAASPIGARPEEVAARVARPGAATILVAVLATVAGFLILIVPGISTVPMVRGFGLLLVVGVPLSFACALTAGLAVLALAARGAPLTRWLGIAGEHFAAAGRGASELLAAPFARLRLRMPARGRLRSEGEAVLDYAVRRPGTVLLAALALALVGWAADAATPVTSDVQKLFPQDVPALKGLRLLQSTSGVSGEIDVMVQGADITSPDVVRWMSGYQQSLLRRYGYTPKRGCGKAVLCPALSLPDLFRGDTSSLTREQIQGLLDQVPPYFSQAVIAPDRRTAALAFGIRLMPLDEQQRVIETMRARLHPPPGVSARLAGLPVEAAQANAEVSSWWRRLALGLGALALVALVLRLARRSWQRALVPLVPIALATGWAGLLQFWTRDTPWGLVFDLGVPLNPMSVTLGALVIALTTEFSVLLSARYGAERERGLDVRAALLRTYRSTGRAVTASAVTALAGFAVLVLSDIRMLRDFGLTTVVDLAISLVGVLVVLPAALALAEDVDFEEAARTALRRLASLRIRRPRRVTPA